MWRSDEVLVTLCFVPCGKYSEIFEEQSFDKQMIPQLKIFRSVIVRLGEKLATSVPVLP